MSRTQDRSTAGSIISVKICTDTFGNLRRDLPACSAVPQPAAPPREAEGHYLMHCTQLQAHNFCKSFFVPQCRTGHCDMFSDLETRNFLLFLSNSG